MPAGGDQQDVTVGTEYRELAQQHHRHWKMIFLAHFSAKLKYM